MATVVFTPSPDGSVTFSRNSPVLVCAQTGSAARNKSAAILRMKFGIVGVALVINGLAVPHLDIRGLADLFSIFSPGFPPALGHPVPVSQHSSEMRHAENA
jgi:hypothetical protein